MNDNQTFNRGEMIAKLQQLRALYLELYGHTSDKPLVGINNNQGEIQIQSENMGLFAPPETWAITPASTKDTPYRARVIVDGVPFVTCLTSEQAAALEGVTA